MVTIIIFILILGVLIFVHELGHFLVARRNGIKAEEFGFGFPPRIFGIKKGDTLYSLNWIPLGGFVKIKGEDGENKDTDSFASKSAWTRTKVLAAGVLMNFALAWFLISICLILGVPEPVPEGETRPDAKIQISEVLAGTPAEQMGLKIGDEISREQKLLSGGTAEIKNIKDFQDYINASKGKEISIQVQRGDEPLKLKGTPRIDYPENQGALGIAMAETATYQYPWYQAFWKGFLILLDLILAMLGALYGIIKSLLLGRSVGVEVAGPVGIAILTKQATELGLVYVLQFVAILSINLGIINALPFPALDGGRILFIIIEKIKRSPVSQKTEQAFHAIGFALLIALMIAVTFRDILNVVK